MSDDSIAHGKRQDWAELRKAALANRTILEKILRVCQAHVLRSALPLLESLCQTIPCLSGSGCFYPLLSFRIRDSDSRDPTVVNRVSMWYSWLTHGP